MTSSFRPAAGRYRMPTVFGPSATRCKTYRRGTGRVEFVRSTWEQLPTMFHIVNALNELPIVRMLGGSVSETVGAKDLSDTRVLR